MKRTTTAAQAGRCPCGRDRDYADCCGRWHGGAQLGAQLGDWPPDAETLMRSRYSAYVLGLESYLLATWHPSTRPAVLALGEQGDHGAIRWLGLEVRAHHRDSDDSAHVEFVARSKQGGRATRLHETSRFVREGGRWFYVDGDFAAG